MPSLTDVVLPCAFYGVTDVVLAGSTPLNLFSQIDIGTLQRIPESWNNWHCPEWSNKVRSFVEVIVVKDRFCCDDDIRLLDLSGYVNLRELKVGSYCFRKVEELKLIGMKYLESVEIGKVSFAKRSYNTADGIDDKRHFYLKNCPKLKSLKIGLKAFLDYSVCEIENVNALEVIEMGDLNDDSWSFFYASLELKSVLILNE